MSCQVVDSKTLDVIVSFMRSNNVPEEICQATGTALNRENLEAYFHRYGEYEAQVPHVYDTSLEVAPAQVIGCINYLEYQILDHINEEFLPGMALLGKLKARILSSLALTAEQVKALPEYVYGM
jgi:hypothetical protein